MAEDRGNGYAHIVGVPCDDNDDLNTFLAHEGGSVAEWLACGTQRTKGPGFKSQPRCCRVTV